MNKTQASGLRPSTKCVGSREPTAQLAEILFRAGFLSTKIRPLEEEVRYEA